MVNTTKATITAEVLVSSGDGALLGAQTPFMRAFERIQLNDIFDLIGAGTVDDAYALLTCTTAGGEFMAFASVIDNRSGDPIYMPAATDGGI